MRFRSIFKWTLILGGACFALYIISSIIYVTSIFASFESSSYQELTDNYESKTKEIYDLKEYINSITSSDKSLEIELDDNNALAIFHVKVNGIRDDNWDIKIKSGKMDTLLEKLNWNKKKLMILKAKLEKANCISVASGEPCQIGFQRSGMGEYFYNLFAEPLTDSLKNTYKSRCTYRLYKSNVILEWGGGAIGNQCFPDF